MKANCAFCKQWTLCVLATLFLAVVACFAGASGVQSDKQLLPLTDKSTAWVLIPGLSDEFNGSRIETSKWDTQLKSWSPYWTWSDKSLTEHNGDLYITMQYAPHKRNARRVHYVSGILRSRLTIKYGYFEAKIRAAPRFPGVSSAFWSSPSRKNGSQWTEIDFVETDQHKSDPRSMDFTLHVLQLPHIASLKSQIHEYHTWRAPWDPSAAFHIYGCEWTPAEISWYVDGVKVESRDNKYWHQPLNISLSLGLRPPLKMNPTASGFPTTMVVDYVRVWTKNKF